MSELRGRRGTNKKKTTPPGVVFAVAPPGLFRPDVVNQTVVVLGSPGAAGSEPKNHTTGPGSVAAQARSE